MTWAFVLEPLPGGRTRLLVRTRGGWFHDWLAGKPLLEDSAGPFGTPITETPSACSLFAAPRVSSPPMGISGRDALEYLRGYALARVGETRTVVFDEHRPPGLHDLQPGPHLMLSVSDTGLGMLRAVMERGLLFGKRRADKHDR